MNPSKKSLLLGMNFQNDTQNKIYKFFWLRTFYLHTQIHSTKNLDPFAKFYFSNNSLSHLTADNLFMS